MATTLHFTRDPSEPTVIIISRQDDPTVAYTIREYLPTFEQKQQYDTFNDVHGKVFVGSCPGALVYDAQSRLHLRSRLVLPSLDKKTSSWQRFIFSTDATQSPIHFTTHDAFHAVTGVRCDFFIGKDDGIHARWVESRDPSTTASSFQLQVNPSYARSTASWVTIATAHASRSAFFSGHDAFPVFASIRFLAESDAFWGIGHAAVVDETAPPTYTSVRRREEDVLLILNTFWVMGVGDVLNPKGRFEGLLATHRAIPKANQDMFLEYQGLKHVRGRIARGI
ncbi:hypothetical protein BC830DRAFT_1081614 [Chytriomyces sp. MP71]|nr:hypothetical protein BC830DRAFT_1081614 [Chytriomyces sp. MP71]